MWGFQKKKVPNYVRIKSVQENYKFVRREKNKEEKQKSNSRLSKSSS
ncbi:MAG: hypothetical protein RBG1_1C00001G1705 [candidate division Zixibacteria bacterium RBG-1]|nr:MAG: hypothetical protein RBG1_1C00001G1705 [candidate division Zixibacteria bacterium RBG-1]